MLTTVLAFTLFAPLTQVNNGSLHNVELPPRREERTMADGTKKQVMVTYTVYFYDGQGIDELKTQENREFRSVNVRPESRGQKFSMTSVWDSDEINENQLDVAMQSLNSYGAPATFGQELFVAVQRARGKSQKGTGQERVSIDPNIDLKPGGWTKRSYGHTKELAMCKYNIWESYDDGNTKSEGSVGGGEFGIGTLWVPVKEPLSERFFPDGEPNRDKQTSMGGMTLEPLVVGVNVQLGLPELGTKPPTQTTLGGYVDTVKKSEWPTIKGSFVANGYEEADLTDICKEWVAAGTDMNWLDLTEAGANFKPEISFPAGTVWVPSDSSFQSMTTGADFGFSLAYADIFTGINMGWQDNPRAMRVLCLNMDKKEPGKGVQYFPYRPSDPVIQRLAKNMNDSRFRGPWDQARMWIYTDKATIEKVNEKLIGGVSSSAYLMALADVDWAGGLDEKMLKDAKFIKPEFMLGSGAPGYASSFLLNTLDEFHPKKAGEWLKKNADSMLKLVSPASDERQQDHLASTLQRLLMFEAKEDREAGLKFIESKSAVLEVLKGKLGSGRVSLYSGRNEEVAVALALVMAGYLTPAADALAYVAEKGPGDANKALAKELMGK